MSPRPAEHPVIDTLNAGFVQCHDSKKFSHLKGIRKTTLFESILPFQPKHLHHVGCKNRQPT